MVASHRAVIGQATQSFLNDLWDEQTKADGNIASVAVLSATWLRLTPDNRRLYLLVRSGGHYDYKRSLIENASRIIIVTTLGRILRVENVATLNEILKLRRPGQQFYTDLDLCHAKETHVGACSDRITLLTTKRRPHSNSPLEHLSSRLHDPNLETMNYRVSHNCPVFEVRAGTKKEILHAEIPLDFAREYFQELYDLPLN
ncbi:MAG: hypothetical protein ACFFDN_35855 [Candidatus Hodarchaeota archaeon]